MKYGLIVILMGLGVMSFGQELTEEVLEGQRRMIEGQKFLLLEEYDKAVAAFRQVPQQDKDRAAAFWGMARAYEAMGDLGQAEKHIREAVNQERDNPWYWLELAQLLKKKRDNEGLIQVYGTLHDLDKSSEEYAFQLVKYLQQAEDWKGALKVLSQMEDKRVQPEITYRKAYIYNAMGSEKKAEKEYLKLIEAFPYETRYRHLLATHYQSQGHTEEAAEQYREILALDPDDSRAALALSNQLRNEGLDVQYLESIRQVINAPNVGIDTKVLELMPFVQKLEDGNAPGLAVLLKEYSSTMIHLHDGEAKAYALKADVHNMLDEKDQALKEYRAALDRDPSVYSVWEQYLYLLADEGDFRTLAEGANAALDYFPNRGRLHFFLALAQVGSGQLDPALSTLKLGQMMVGKDTRLQYDMYVLAGRAEYLRGHPEEARVHFEAALQIHDKDPYLLGYGALALLSLEEVDKAKGLLSQARVSGVELPIVGLCEALLQAQEGNVDAALEKINSLPQGGGDDALILEKMGDLLWVRGSVELAVEKWKAALSRGGYKSRLEKKVVEKKTMHDRI